jgi:hypothetical protein
MSNWILKNLSYLSEGSKKSVNTGQTPIIAKYKKTFLNIETSELREVTDLESKIHKRNNYLKLFFEVYSKYFTKKSHSVLCVVVNQEEYSTITKFVNTLTRKLQRKGVDRLGYVWVRDVGDEIFHKHFHIIVATTRISAEQFNELFFKKDHNNYEVQFLKTPKGMAKYITDKDLYGCSKQRSYGKSRFFPIKKQIKAKKIYTNVN